MKKIPVTLIIDDPAPVISVYYTHCDPKITKDGTIDKYIEDADTKSANALEG